MRLPGVNTTPGQRAYVTADAVDLASARARSAGRDAVLSASRHAASGSAGPAAVPPAGRDYVNIGDESLVRAHSYDEPKPEPPESNEQIAHRCVRRGFTPRVAVDPTALDPNAPPDRRVVDAHADCAHEHTTEGEPSS
jgi:hypothetical protein